MRSATVPRYLARLESAGREPGPLLARFGLPADAARRPFVEVPLSVLHALPEAVAAELGEPWLGLRLAQAMPPAAFGLIELCGRSAPTLGGGMERLVRYSRLLNALELFALESRGAEAALTHAVPGEPLALGRQGNEQLLALLVRIVRELLGRPWSPARVELAHPAPADAAELARFFGCPLRFGAEVNALVFPAAELGLPVATHDPSLLGVLDEQAQRRLEVLGAPDPALGRLRELLREKLPGGPPSLAAAAGLLHMSERTLQRRLAAQGQSYQDLLEQTRRELALRALREGSAKLDEVAYRLGYADAGAFVRAFRRWTGTTPGRFREQAARA